MFGSTAFFFALNLPFLTTVSVFTHIHVPCTSVYYEQIATQFNNSYSNLSFSLISSISKLINCMCTIYFNLIHHNRKKHKLTILFMEEKGKKIWSKKL